MLESSSVFVTGGAGTIGHAIAKMRKEKGWTGKMTVYSSDAHKHEQMHRLYPDIQFVQGDIRNPETLYAAMVGHDIVIHAAACKIIPVSEYNCLDTFDVNVNGSLNVLACAIRAGVKHVLGISTDKAAHPANSYGMSKAMMEKIFQEYARTAWEYDTHFHLTRYGNILESNGSVIEAWKKSIAAGQPIKMTDPEMTRFWLSPQQGVRCIIRALDQESGVIYIPKCPALSIGKLAAYSVNYSGMSSGPNFPVEKIDMRPGEKMDETLLTIEEADFAVDQKDYFLLYPTTHPRIGMVKEAYSSDIAPELTQAELLDLLRNE